MAACCEPRIDAVMHPSDAEALAGLLKALADPTRLRLVSALAGLPDHEACVCDLPEVVGVSQPTVSHHLKVLAEAGLVDRRKDGTWVHYRLRPEALASLAGAILVDA